MEMIQKAFAYVYIHTYVDKSKYLFLHFFSIHLWESPKLISNAFKTWWCQKIRGILCNLTRIRIFETTIVLASKLGNHGFTKRSTLPQNHGP